MWAEAGWALCESMIVEHLLEGGNEYKKSVQSFKCS